MGVEDNGSVCADYLGDKIAFLRTRDGSVQSIYPRWSREKVLFSHLQDPQYIHLGNARVARAFGEGFPCYQFLELYRSANIVSG